MEFNEVKILIVDDEPDILEFLQYNLNKKGFLVYSAADGFAALKIAKETIPHVIILDLMMPGMDGVETCQKIKEIPELEDTMIAFLTVRNEEYTEVAAFEAGADDYVKKPIRIRLLLSHITALLKRHPQLRAVENGNKKDIGFLTIDKDRFEIQQNGEKVLLSKKEFDILWLLASKPGKVFLRNDIYYSVWGNDVIVGQRTIDVHISKLRDKIGKDIIKTIKGIGYRLEVN